jgi:hypothetical protein
VLKIPSQRKSEKNSWKRRLGISWCLLSYCVAVAVAVAVKFQARESTQGAGRKECSILCSFFGGKTTTPVPGFDVNANE